ncbi:MAG: fused MFS/spermidine synthase [Acidobacteriota bacterium]
MIGRTRALPPLALIVAVSGAAGLIHEVVWARLLGQSLGHSLQSLSAVLVAFLGGLGLGAAIASRAARRCRSPLRDYAFLESIMALHGLLGPLVAAGIALGMERLGPALGDGAPQAALRLLLACLALSPLTLAMGATFPLIVREAEERGVGPGRTVARLYGWNTVGGAAGAAIGAFALMPLLGARVTLGAAALLNLLAAAGAVVLRRAAPGAGGPGGRGLRTASSGPPRPSGPGVGGPPGPVAAALAAAALSGAVGASLQVGWTRTMTLAFGSTVYALGLTLAAYLLGIGAGPLLLPSRLLRRGTGAALAAASQWAVAVSSLLLIPLLGFLPRIAAALSGGLGSPPALLPAAQFGVAFACLLVPTLAQGATFPALALWAAGPAAPRDTHRAAGRVYAASTWGSVAGFLATGFLLVPAWGTERTLRGAGLCALLLAGALLAAATRWGDRATAPRGRLRARLAAVAGIALPLALLALPSWDRALVSSGGFLYGPVYRAAREGRSVTEAMRQRGSILFERESGDGLVTVRRSRAGILSLQINGKTEASTGGDMATQLLAAHLPLLLHPDPRQVLVIGLASGVTVGAAERYPAEAIHVIEISPAVVAAARLFGRENGSALDDTRLRLIVDDARAWLLARPRRFDVIASQPSNPWVAGVANLFTEEFYRLVRRRLSDGGLFCQWVQAYRLDPVDLRGIVRSFLAVFPDATLWEESAGSGDYFLIGGLRPLRLDPSSLWERAGAAVHRDLRRAGVRSIADLLARFVAGPGGLRALSAGAQPHTDDNLYLEWRAPLALFRDTLKLQVAGLNRHRETIYPLLPPGLSRTDPGLVEGLRRRLAERRRRLQILDSLEEADLLSLTNPYMAAGIGYLRAGLFAEAASALRRVEQEEPDSAVAELLLGEAYRAAGLDEAAEVVLREAVGRHPDLAPAWNALGRSLVARGQLEAARAAFERALVSAPDLASARNNLGVARLQAGDLEGAEGCFREALASDPWLAAARANLGLVRKRRGDRAGAEEAYRAALDLDPLNTDARYNLATLLQQTGRAAAARREFAEILRIDPGDRAAAEALERAARARPASALRP